MTPSQAATETDNLPVPADHQPPARAKVTKAHAKRMLAELLEARQAINAAAGDWHRRYVEMYETGAYAALGYPDWTSFVTEELGMSRDQSYRMLDRSHVLADLHDLGVEGPASMVSGRQGRVLAGKPEAAREIAERVEQGEEPRKAVARVARLYRGTTESTPAVAQRREPARVIEAEAEPEVLTVVPEPVRDLSEMDTATLLAFLRVGRDRQNALEAEVREVLLQRTRIFAALYLRTTFIGHRRLLDGMPFEDTMVDNMGISEARVRQLRSEALARGFLTE